MSKSARRLLGTLSYLGLLLCAGCLHVDGQLTHTIGTEGEAAHVTIPIDDLTMSAGEVTLRADGLQDGTKAVGEAFSRIAGSVEKVAAAVDTIGKVAESMPRTIDNAAQLATLDSTSKHALFFFGILATAAVYLMKKTPTVPSARFAELWGPLAAVGACLLILGSVMAKYEETNVVYVAHWPSDLDSDCKREAFYWCHFGWLFPLAAAVVGLSVGCVYWLRCALARGPVKPTPAAPAP